MYIQLFNGDLQGLQTSQENKCMLNRSITQFFRFSYLECSISNYFCLFYFAQKPFRAELKDEVKFLLSGEGLKQVRFRKGSKSQYSGTSSHYSGGAASQLHGSSQLLSFNWKRLNVGKTILRIKNTLFWFFFHFKW